MKITLCSSMLKVSHFEGIELKLKKNSSDIPENFTVTFHV